MEASSSTILDGKATAKEVREDVRRATASLLERGIVPGLSVIIVGEDPASQVYVRNKEKAAEQVGFRAETVRLPADCPQSELEAEVDRLVADERVHGILVQLPLPEGLDEAAVLTHLAAHKDVDGLTAANVAALAMGQPGLRPCTPAGCIELLDRHEIPLEGREVVIVGRSQLVGKPLAQLCLERNATVTICHSRTRNLAEHCRRADILIAAVGRARLIRADWVRPGAIVLDVGINRGADGKLVGDVDFGPVSKIAGALTPVPGGIGPMTIAMLLANTLRAAARANGLDPTELLG